MSARTQPRMPLRLIVLDFLGTALLAIGFLELFAGDAGLMPEGLRFAGHEWILILLGLLIMLPALFGIVAHIRRAARQQHNTERSN